MDFKSTRCKNLTPYVCGEQPQDKKYIKLNTNENPYPPTPKIDKYLKECDIANLRLYPDPNNVKLRNAISNKYNINIENVFVGNGSDEILSFLFYAFFNENGNGIGFFDITYSFYPVYADYFNIKKNIVKLDSNFKGNLNELDKTNSEGYIICNPNAPTGIEFNLSELENFVSKNLNKIIIIDEAYSAFGNTTAVSFASKYDNVLIVKTLSKGYSLAGIRCGYALGNANLIEGLNRVKNSINSYTVNRLTEEIAEIAINDEDYYLECTKKIIAAREFTIDKLKELGFNALNSNSNFVFASCDKISGQELYLKLKENGILVRHFNKDRINNFIRITIGTLEDMQYFIKIIKKILRLKDN